MSQKKKFLFCVLLFGLAMLACGPLQQATSVPVPTSTSPLIPALVPSSTTTLIPITPTAKALTPTLVPVPSATTIPTVISLSPFQGVISLAGRLGDSTGVVQVHAMADGSVWIIAPQTILTWNYQANQVLDAQPYNGEAQLATIDNFAQVWLLSKDIGVIASCQGPSCTPFTADSGWTSVGPFNVNWWATTPWNIYHTAGGMRWVPMERDVRAFDGARWSVYTLEDMGFTDPEMEDIGIVHYLGTAEDSADVWVGECFYSGPGPVGGGGVRWFDGQTWHGEDFPVGSKCVSALTLDDKGDMWLAASIVVWHYDHTGQSWTKYQMPEELLSGYNFTHPHQLIIDKSGDVWVIEQMCGGASCDVGVNLYRIHAGEWSLVIEAEYWGSSFKQLVLDGNRQGWLFWEGMFYKLEGNQLEPVSSIAARGADVSPAGSIWVVVGSGDEVSLQVLEP